MSPRADAPDAAALVAHLQAHSHDPDAQARCCQALCNSGPLLLSGDAGVSFLPAILAALRAHPRHAELQTYGCLAWGHICGGMEDAELVSAAGAAERVCAVVHALRAHPADAQLQSFCCRALYIMTRPAALREMAIAAGAVQVIVAALHAHVLYADVGMVCEALSRNTADHPLATAQAGAAGALPATVAVMRAHFASAHVQASGCAPLGSLT
jgi:hypothetical protein